MKRLLVALCMTVGILLLFSAPALGATFSDVPPGDAELTEATGFLYGLGIVLGYPDGTFRPENALTWGQAANMFSRTPFATGYDLSPWAGQPYLCSRGMAAAFFPGLTWHEDRWQEPITRGQAARLIYRYIVGG